MTVENATFISDLVLASPADTDVVAEGGAQLRLLKTVLKNTFPSASFAVPIPSLSTANANITFAAVDNGNLRSVDATGGNVTALLPMGSTISPGYKVGILKSDGTTNTVGFLPQGSDVIKGGGNLTLNYPWQQMSVMFIGNGVWIADTPPFAGSIIDRLDKIPLPGYVVMTGSIGNVGSAANNRANADCESLFHVIWRNCADSEATVVGGRGASAKADWDANKAIFVPDARGRTCIGATNMLGTSTTVATSIDGTKLGIVGGEETHKLIPAEMAAHTHDLDDPGHDHDILTLLNFSNISFNANGASVWNGQNATKTGKSMTGITVKPNVGDMPHNNLQPSLVVFKQIRL